jgi:RNA-directed DNA polymerase
VGEEVPRLLDDVAQETKTKDSTRIGTTTKEPHPRTAAKRPGRRVIMDLQPLLTGWIQYFKLAEIKSTFEQLDEWLRRKLRRILWKQWKTPLTRAKRLMARGIDRTRAYTSVNNGHGPWWNAGASHMNTGYRLNGLYSRGS